MGNKCVFDPFFDLSLFFLSGLSMHFYFLISVDDWFESVRLLKFPLHAWSKMSAVSQLKQWLNLYLCCKIEYFCHVCSDCQSRLMDVHSVSLLPICPTEWLFTTLTLYIVNDAVVFFGYWVSGFALDGFCRFVYYKDVKGFYLLWF